MRKLCHTGFCLLISAIAFSQVREIDVKKIYQSRITKYLIMEDSSIAEYDLPMLEVIKFYIILDKVFFDDQSKQYRLTGKVSLLADTGLCLGVPGVSIFKGVRENNILKSETDLSVTSYNRDSLEKDGFFDVTFSIGNKESLFFYMPHFYLEEFQFFRNSPESGVIKQEKKDYLHLPSGLPAAAKRPAPGVKEK